MSNKLTTIIKNTDLLKRCWRLCNLFWYHWQNGGDFDVTWCDVTGI